MSWNSNDGNPRSQYIFNHHGAGTDSHIVSHADATENLGVLPNIYIVADDGGVIGITTIAADAAVSVDDTALADSCFRIHDNGAEVLQVQVLAEASSADDESQSRSQSILPATIPEAE